MLDIIPTEWSVFGRLNSKTATVKSKGPYSQIYGAFSNVVRILPEEMIYL